MDRIFAAFLSASPIEFFSEKPDCIPDAHAEMFDQLYRRSSKSASGAFHFI